MTETELGTWPPPYTNIQAQKIRVRDCCRIAWQGKVLECVVTHIRPIPGSARTEFAFKWAGRGPSPTVELAPWMNYLNTYNMRVTRRMPPFEDKGRSRRKRRR